MTTAKTRVLVVGGGFGGIKAALELADAPHLEVTLLSDHDSFYYYPTLYHTATGGAEAQSKIPLARVFEGKNVTIAHGRAQHLDRKAKIIKTTDGTKFAYDILVLSLGSVPNYFGIKGIEEYSFNIVTPDNAHRFKQHLHKQLADGRDPDLSYVIVGGGPTGIELAGALTGYLQEIMKAHGVKDRRLHVDLVEAAPKLVPRMPDRMGKAIARRLKSLGVRLYLNQKVEGMTADTLTVNGKPIQSHTVVWNAGTATNPFYKENNFAMSDRGKIAVDEYLQAEPDIYVIGDNAATEYSGMAQTALYDGHYVADNIERQQAGRLMKRYVPKRPIYVIPVGHNWAAVLWGNRQIYGIAGWMLRLAADMVGFKDYEPWWRATRQWMTEFQNEESCETCAKSQQKP
ncbi:MAG TPA: FAD-dependent oxidoreductase [Candidatus Saccharimonadales bacterium]